MQLWGKGLYGTRTQIFGRAFFSQSQTSKIHGYLVVRVEKGAGRGGACAENFLIQWQLYSELNRFQLSESNFPSVRRNVILAKRSLPNLLDENIE